MVCCIIYSDVACISSVVRLGGQNDEQTTRKRIKVYYIISSIKFCNKYIHPIDNQKC